MPIPQHSLYENLAAKKIVFLNKITTMPKKDGGLADTQEGEFILNESGTAVSTDPVEGVDSAPAMKPELKDKEDDEEKDANQIAEENPTFSYNSKS